MKRSRAVTLVELIVAISLIGVMAIAIGTVATTLYTMKKDVLDSQTSLVQGTQATVLVFERVLRAAAVTSGAAFTISQNGTRIDYRRPGATERIWQDGNAIKYYDGVVERVVLKGVNKVLFAQDYANRLALEINMLNGQNFRCAVQPRNEFTPGSVIN